MQSTRRLKRRRSMLYALIALAIGSPTVQADVFDDAWSCAVAVKEGVVDTAIIGGKALKFIATKPDCVSRLGTPATAAPFGVVVGLANIGVLPKSQPSCSGKLYGTAAKPVAEALNATLGELGVLPDGAKDQLIGISAGGISGEVLAEIPGMDFVSGSLTCGCDLVDAGLTTETIEKVLNTADNIGDECGGPVWDKAKEIAGDVVNFAGDAAEEGIRQVSNLGDALAGQTKHVPYLDYYNQHWAPKVEFYAAHEFNNPDSWHGGKLWQQVWNPCVSYFDGHTQAEDTARYTCDNMRSGGPLFPKTYFGHQLFQRVFEFETSVLVNSEREKAHAEFSELKSGAELPASITEDTECYASASIKLQPVLPAMRKAAINEVFGVPKKEQNHNGIAVDSSAPPALWPVDTFGAYALTYFPKVDAGQFRADSAKAVNLALADFNAEERIRAKLAEKVVKHYEANKCFRVDTSDLNQEKINSLVSQCPTESCKDTITNDYQVCASENRAWVQENSNIMFDADTSEGRNLRIQSIARDKACVSEAEHTLTTERNAHAVETMVGQCSKSTPREKLDGDYKACAAAEESWYETNRPTVGKYTSEYVDKIDEGWKGFNDACLEAARTTYKSCRLSINDLPAKTPGPVQVPGTRDGGLIEASEPRRQLSPEELRRARGSMRQYEVPADLRITRDQRISTGRAAGVAVVPGVAPITDADLPGCYVFGRSASSRVYACSDSTAYDNCLAVVERDSSVTCRMSKD